MATRPSRNDELKKTRAELATAQERLAKLEEPRPPRKGKIAVRMVDVVSGMSAEEQEREEQDTQPLGLSKSITKLLNGPGASVERLAFEQDPTSTDTYAGIYRPKQRLLPDNILKRIAIQDDLIACIVQARCNQMSTFGRPLNDRFGSGFVIEPNKRSEQTMEEAEKKQLQQRIDRAVKRLSSCGQEDGWEKLDRLSFAEWLYQSTRNAIVVGRIATEVIRLPNETTGELEFHGFRPIDAGTIYFAVPHRDANQQIREGSRTLLEQLKGVKIDAERFVNDEYDYVQVIEGRPLQAFSDDDCLVRNFYPVTDIELAGYPVTPLDTAITAVTTHINISTHNKLYFQSGRATRGMIIVQSDDADESTVNQIRQQFMASINSVSNAWRMPVFAVGAEESVTWQPIDQGARDMEFQYLSDMNARTLLSAFQMSPDELPGWAYLSKGTNNQSLSESNNEYRLEAHRDLGIRPLIKQFEDFLNTEILPLIDPKLAEICIIRLTGLDAETAEKESVRLQQDMPVHMTMNEVYRKVEKKVLPPEMGGDFPLNPQWQAVADKYVKVGMVLETFFGVKGASQNPEWDYVRDPFYWQQREWQMQQQQMQAQQQAQAAGGGQPQPGQDGGGGGEDGGGGEGGQEGQEGGQEAAGGQQDAGGEGQQGGDPNAQQGAAQGQQAGPLVSGIDQALGSLQKAEHQLPPAQKRLLNRQRRLVDDIVKGLDNDLKRATLQLVEQVDRMRPRN